MDQEYDQYDTIVARVFDIDISMLRSRTRKYRAASARFLVFSIREAQGLDVSQIAVMYNRNPETIRHGIKRKEEMLQYDKRFRQRCQEVEDLLDEDMLPYHPSRLRLGATVRTRLNSKGHAITGTVARIADDFFVVECFEHPSFVSQNFIATGRCSITYETSHDIILIAE